MKQWLLLAMASTSDTPLTFTKLGELMGCSRQNVKKLALALEKKGFISIQKNEYDSRACCLFVDTKMGEYLKRVEKMQYHVLEYLFQGYTESELQVLYNSMMKLYAGIEHVESYVEEVKNSRKWRKNE